jgi:NTP pyrophosphatase (non-canonical NTP hydrolase)
MTFRQFAEANRARCESPEGFNHSLGSWSLSDWMVAVAGEVGEAANVVKKLNRCRDGIPGNTASESDLYAALGDEIADAVTYLDLIAQSQGFSLEDLILDKFNRKSASIGYPHRLEE